MGTTIIKKPKVDISSQLLEEISAKVHEAGQVVLHVLFSVPQSIYPSYIRIWPSTFLYDKASPHKSELVHAENITYYPQWHECKPGGNYFFSLIFNGLPKTCTSFDFIEHCTNQSGAFAVFDIKRNDSDVYYLRMT